MNNVADLELASPSVARAYFMRMMTFQCGGRAVGVPYTWRARQRGLSKNSAMTLIDQATASYRSRLRPSLSAVHRLRDLSGQPVLRPGEPVNRPAALPPTRRAERDDLDYRAVLLSRLQLSFMGIIGEYGGAIYAQLREKSVMFERERISFEIRKATGLKDDRRRGVTRNDRRPVPPNCPTRR